MEKEKEYRVPELTRILKTYGFEWPDDKYGRPSRMNDVMALVDNSKRKGTIDKATGVGKSWDIITLACRAIWEQAQAGWDNKKLILNVGAHILDLDRQIFKDMMEVLYNVFSDQNSKLYIADFNIYDELYIVNNLSAEAGYFEGICNMWRDGYDDQIVMPYNPKCGFDPKRNTKKVVIVVSCYKSLSSFMKQLNAGAYNKYTVWSLWDECHKISLYETADDDTDVIDQKVIGEFVDNVDYLYCFSATPNMHLVELINEHAENPGDPFLILITPKEAIDCGYIEAPRIVMVKVSTNELTADEVKQAILDFENEQEYKSLGIQKTMYTAPMGSYDNAELVDDGTREEKRIETINKELSNDPIFAAEINDDIRHFYITSAASGKVSTTQVKRNGKPYDTTSFLKEINDAGHKCVVGQIKQMTTGLDVKALNQLIMYMRKSIDGNSKAGLMQTIGRVIRSAEGEYGMPLELKTKKFGVVYILANESVYVEACKKMRDFADETYGVKSIYMMDGWAMPGKSKDKKKLTYSKAYEHNKIWEVSPLAQQAYEVLIEKCREALSLYDGLDDVKADGLGNGDYKWILDTFAKKLVDNGHYTMDEYINRAHLEEVIDAVIMDMKLWAK